MEAVVTERLGPKPGDKRIENCPKHGGFTATFLDRAFYLRRWSACEKCEQEYKEACDELRRRQKRKNESMRQLVNSGVPLRLRRKTLQNFAPENDDQRAAYAYAVSYAEKFSEHLAEGRSLSFIGPVGVGKSHLACAILLAVAEQCYAVRYTTASGLIYSIRGTWHRESPKTAEQVLQELCECRLLLIDDVGCLAAEQEYVRYIIEKRHNDRLPTMITTNLDIEKLTDHIDARALDRLRENGGRMFALSGDSRRAKPESTSVNEPLWWEKGFDRSATAEMLREREESSETIPLSDYPGLWTSEVETESQGPGATGQ